MNFIIYQYSFASVPRLWPYPYPPPLPANPSPVLPPPWPNWPGVHVLYTEALLPPGVDPDPANPAPAATFRYQDSTQVLSFSGAQITDQSTAVGRLLTVTLVPAVDQGSTLFSLVLPGAVEPAAGALTPMSTFGITTRNAGPTTVPKPAQAMQYATMDLTGTLSLSQVPPGTS
jgi:hypothetical protein